MESIFSAPTFIFLKFLCLSSSEGFVGRISVLTPLAISEADWDNDVGVPSSLLIDVSDDPGDPTDVCDNAEVLDLRDGGSIVWLGADDRIVLRGDGVSNDPEALLD